MKRSKDALYSAALDRLLADCAEFLSRYAWTAQHDESHDLYERIVKAREYIAQHDGMAQGVAR